MKANDKSERQGTTRLKVSRCNEEKSFHEIDVAAFRKADVANNNLRKNGAKFSGRFSRAFSWIKLIYSQDFYKLQRERVNGGTVVERKFPRP